MTLDENEIHCHIWHDLTREQSRGAKLIPRTLELYPGVSGEIGQTDKGKPYLSNACCQVSVAHSGRLALVVLARSSSIGCDIEYCKEREFARIGESYFHANESAAINNAACAMPLFYGLWTLKEAYGKAVGTGVAAALGQDFSHIAGEFLSNPDIVGYVERDKVALTFDPDIPGYGFLARRGPANYSIAIALETPRVYWTLKCLNH